MIVDDRATLEIYPLFDDVPGKGGATVIAPRLIDLARTPRVVEGSIHRRYMQGVVLCEARTPIHVLRCEGDQLELTLADPEPPMGFAPCACRRPTLPTRALDPRLAPT